MVVVVESYREGRIRCASFSGVRANKKAAMRRGGAAI
jgi:hypothetical protein